MDSRSLSRRLSCRDGWGRPSSGGRPPAALRRTAWQWALLVSVWVFGSAGAAAPSVELGEAGMDSLGRRMTAANDSAWERADSLFRAGVFGDPRSEGARTRALTHFMLRARVALDYLADLCADPVVHRVNEACLTRPFGLWYANTAVFPIRFLEQGLVGDGGFCLQYALPAVPSEGTVPSKGTVASRGGAFDQRVMLGGVPVRVRSDQVREDDAPDPKPALGVEFSSRLDTSIELLFLSEVRGRARRETIIDRGDTLELITVTDIEGMYARRAGTHRAAALIHWRSVTAGDRAPARPRAGACGYFPRICIRLPFFLPDLGLDDLREFDLPNPVISMDWARTHRSTPWVSVSPDAFFRPWEAIGPRPLEVDRRFPDL